MSRSITFKDLIDAFSWGVDYGQLLMEQERDSEDLFDAMGCAIYSAKKNVPSSVAPRRQPHSGAWRNVKADSVRKFIALYGKICATKGGEDG